MRKIELFTILALLFMTNAANAQITLVHSFNKDVTWTGSMIVESDSYPNNTFSYASITDNIYTITIYNTDFTVLSNNSYSFNSLTGYTLFSVTVSKNLFNSDDNMEFMITYRKTNLTGGDTDYKLILYAANGTIIKDFGTAHYIYFFPGLYVANSAAFLKVSKMYSDGSVACEIYSVAGNFTATSDFYEPTSHSLPYPNPANDIIFLPYSLATNEKAMINIYDIQGKLIDTKSVNGSSSALVLDVSGYSNGIYIYDINGLKYRFVVE